MAPICETLRGNLEAKGQTHLLQFWEDLGAEQQQLLANQLGGINLDAVTGIFEKYSNPVAEDVSDVQPINAEQCASTNECSPEVLLKYWNTGLKSVSEGQLAVVVLAGGQATRLGASEPKGTLSMGLKQKPDSLLALQAKQIHKLQDMARQSFPDSKSTIQWYVMASDATLQSTKDHFEAHIFGRFLDPQNVHFFCQAQFPCFTTEGKLILAEKHKLQTSPDGNGGLYPALKPLLPQLESQGVTSVHVYCVDNILCRVADPHFVGYCIDKGADCAAKVVTKTDPSESIGVACNVNGVPRVLEYSEISSTLAQMPDAKDPAKLAFRAGNIANHFFTTDFLKKVCSSPLPYHPAFKKIPFIDQNGEKVKPEKPNGIKMEQFVFDVFKHSKNFHLWEVSREDEFSPLKNPDSAGKDCMATCRRDLRALHMRWIQNAGAKLTPSIEIDSQLSYAGEGLSDQYKGQVLEACLLLQ